MPMRISAGANHQSAPSPALQMSWSKYHVSVSAIIVVVLHVLAFLVTSSGGAILVSTSALLSTFLPPLPDMSKYSQAINTPTEASAKMARRASTVSTSLLNEIFNAAQPNQEPALSLLKDMDVVISSGGFRGQYAGGVLSIVQQLERAGVVKVHRWAGASIGACTAAFFALNHAQDFEAFFRVPYAWQAVWNAKTFWRGGPIIQKTNDVGLPRNVTSLLNGGKLFVSLTTVTWWPTRIFSIVPIIKNQIVHKFESRQELVDALSASSAVPFLYAGSVNFPFYNLFRGQITLDGAITNGKPIFQDHERPQLVIDLGKLDDYSVLYTLTPIDPNHEIIVQQGQDDVVELIRSILYQKDRQGSQTTIQSSKRSPLSILDAMQRHN